MFDDSNVGESPKWPKLSPTSPCCHQYISSPTSVTNVDVTDVLTFFIFDFFDFCEKSLKPTKDFCSKKKTLPVQYLLQTTQNPTPKHHIVFGR